jgi:hypothetical protein
MKKIRGKILNATYIPQARCIMIKLKDENNGKILKPIALYEESFKFKPGQDVDTELEKTTELFKRFKYSITIAYDPEKQQGDIK